MNGNKAETSAFLRQKAEDVLKKRQTHANSQNYIAESLRLIHELEVHQIEMEMQNEELVLMNAEKDMLFSILAHDLRGPFSAFLGFTDILAEEATLMDPDRLKEIAFSLRGAARNVYQLIDNLLEWSRMQRGLIEHKPETISLVEVVTHCTNTMSEMACLKELDIHIQVPSDLHVYADKSMLEATLRNLLTNAIKFSFRGEEILIYGRFIQHNFIEVSVVDSGIGIDEDIMNDLFNISGRAGRKGTEGESSSGLGLMICKNFIERNGGKILIKSQEGKGSTFSFTLPVSGDVY